VLKRILPLLILSGSFFIMVLNSFPAGGSVIFDTDDLNEKYNATTIAVIMNIHNNLRDFIRLSLQIPWESGTQPPL